MSIAVFGFSQGGNRLWYDIALVAPSLAFLLFMSFRARKSVHKLTQTRSAIISAYYSLLWLVSILNLLWCVVRAWQGDSQDTTTWNWLSLITSFSMVLLEVSVVVFLLQGNNITGWGALRHTLMVSTIIAGLDAVIKVIYLFGFQWPLFIDGNDIGDRRKWGFWLTYKLSFVALYASVLSLPHTKWQNRLPARPAFYNYICAMFLLNTISAFGCGLLVSGVGFGYWIYGFSSLCYHALYPPFLYSTFLADFFQENDLHLEDVYYSEMKDAGYFDADWD
eukprot:TRINITY_DN21048_c0_g1_i2.p1 TRINITY_DN21048_c0_g1~~TRINITY_DN21048_c0_g1_i2.p1  ORF type:complete len:278 (+),score=24.13 TRINITY_DN21048_c0_g1_i2:252-1085(+)